MKEDEIFEGNKIIAEFMGYKLDGNIVKSAPLDPDGFDSWDQLVGYNISQARYDTFWDWLMPVASKISTVPSKHNRRAIYDGRRFNIVFGLLAYNIEMTWKGAVEFIIDHNK
jgi:hypothetical protein